MVNVDTSSLAEIFDVSSSDISVDVNERSHTLEEEPLEELDKAGIIDTNSGRKVTVEAMVNAEIVCEIDYMIFGDVGYIHWTSVPEEYQSRGVATAVRSGVVDDLRFRGVSVMYSYPASQTGLLLAKKQGFSETDDLSHGFGTWLKRSV